MQMSIWHSLAVIVILIVVGAVLYVLARRPYCHKNVMLSDIRVYLEALLKRGYEGGFIVISEVGSKRFIQFEKYIRGKGNIGLQLSFPRAHWSDSYFQALKSVLAGQNIRFEIQRVDADSVAEFLEVDCHSDLGLAVRLVDIIARQVFQMKDAALFEIRFTNVSARDELIDTVQESDR